MMCIEKITDNIAQEFKNACNHYHNVYNTYFEYTYEHMDAKYGCRRIGERINKKFNINADKRLYDAIPRHIKERGDRISDKCKLIYNLRLHNVYIIRGQFIFNGIVFSYKDLKKKHKNEKVLVETVKISLYKNTITATLHGKKVISTSHKYNKHYFNICDYKFWWIVPVNRNGEFHP